MLAIAPGQAPRGRRKRSTLANGTTAAEPAAHRPNPCGSSVEARPVRLRAPTARARARDRGSVSVYRGPSMDFAKLRRHVRQQVNARSGHEHIVFNPDAAPFWKIG